MTAARVFGAALGEGADAELMAHDEAGTAVALPLARWLGPAGPVDERVLVRARGPVLDVGCGPGRHVHALARRGVLGLGVDVSPVAVRLARHRGVMVHEGSIFDRIPGAGTWRTALLLDGNIGIGGDPAALLRRLARLLAPGGAVLAELDRPGTPAGPLRVRLEHAGRRSAPFAWARVTPRTVASTAGPAGMTLADCWHDQGRWFAALARP